MNWDDNERWELINGKAYCMSPAPSREHQFISRQLVLKIGNFLDGKPCEIYNAPFDVSFPEENQIDEDIETIVQTDIIVVCDETKLNTKGCIGAPDFIIEITSPSTIDIDLKVKFNLWVLLNTCFGIYTKRFFSEAKRQNRSIVCLYEDFDNAASEKKIEYKTK